MTPKRSRSWFIERGFAYPAYFLGVPLLEEVVWRDGWLRKGVDGAAIRGRVVLVHIGQPSAHAWICAVSKIDAQWKLKQDRGYKQ